MKLVTHKIDTYYRYNGKFYAASKRKNLRVNDIFIDGRDYGVKIIEDVQDLFDLAYMAPEAYVILEEATVQN
jgi:hypothetical protein